MTINVIELLAKIVLSSKDMGENAIVDIVVGAVKTEGEEGYFGHVIFNDNDELSYTCDVRRDTVEEASEDAEKFAEAICDRLSGLTEGEVVLVEVPTE